MKRREMQGTKWCPHDVWSFSMCDICNGRVKAPKVPGFRDRISSSKRQRTREYVATKGDTSNERNCWAKVQYVDRATAEDRVHRSQMRGVLLYPYQCTACGFWHLTSHKHDRTK